MIILIPVLAAAAVAVKAGVPGKAVRAGAPVAAKAGHMVADAVTDALPDAATAGAIGAAKGFKTGGVPGAVVGGVEAFGRKLLAGAGEATPKVATNHLGPQAGTAVDEFGKEMRKTTD